MKTLSLILFLMVSAFGQNRPRHRAVVIHSPVIPIVIFGGYGHPTVVVDRNPTFPCKKEKLKDSNGKKHEVLVCRQPDGSFQVVADANKPTK